MVGSAVQMFGSSGGKRIYSKRVIGTVWQYPEPESAREAVRGLLREISPNPLQRSSRPMPISELCDHFVQRELTNDNTWRSYSTKRAYKPSREIKIASIS